MVDISLYFHIPFCTKKCPYCHFFVLPNRPSAHTLLMEGLRKEWQLIRPLLADKNIVSIYFGGGTPSLLGPKQIGTILSWIPHSPIAEITLESNPEDVSLESMQAFNRSGINRISLGIQSLDNPLLKRLGRAHSAQRGIDAVHTVKAAGIDNISIDLMYDIPYQTLPVWQHTLDQAALLPITHLSLYNLTFEEGALFFAQRKKLSPYLPSPQTSFTMLQTAYRTLEKAGLQQYEISAFARPDFQARHNTGYWTGRPFLGLGPSAFSFWEGRRFRNICNLTKYHATLLNGHLPCDFEEKLSPLASLHERLAIHLRLLQGAPSADFPIDPALLTRLEKQGWITWSSTTIQLTEQGRLFYDSVAEEIILTD